MFPLPDSLAAAIQIFLRIEKALREYLTRGSHPKRWIAAAGKSGNGNAVSSGMITKSNVVLQALVLVTHWLERRSAKTKTMGSIRDPHLGQLFLLGLTFAIIAGVCDSLSQ